MKLRKLFQNSLVHRLAFRGMLGISESDFKLFQSPGGSQLSLDGGTVASVAGVMPAPTGLITFVSGVLAITGITIPYSTFSGMIVYVPTALWTWTAATNIALAGSAVVNKALVLVYYQGTAKWYPNYIA